MSALTLPLDCAAAPKSGQLCSFENYLCVTLCKNVLPNSKLLDILLSLQQIKQPSLHEGARIASMSLANHWHAAYRKYSSMMSSTKNGQCIATNAPVHLNEKTYSLFLSHSLSQEFDLFAVIFRIPAKNGLICSNLQCSCLN